MKKYPIYSVRNFSRNDIHRDFYVNTFKEHLKSHSFIEEPHRHDSYLMVFLQMVPEFMKSILTGLRLKKGVYLFYSPDKCIIGVYLITLKGL